jgi:hypothetical protein
MAFKKCSMEQYGHLATTTIIPMGGYSYSKTCFKIFSLPLLPAKSLKWKYYFSDYKSTCSICYSCIWCDSTVLIFMPTDSHHMISMSINNFLFIKFWLTWQTAYFKKPHHQKLTNLKALVEHTWPQIHAIKQYFKHQPLIFSEYVVLLETRISTQHNLKVAHHYIIFMKYVSFDHETHQPVVWNVTRIWQNTLVILSDAYYRRWAHNPFNLPTMYIITRKLFKLYKGTMF